MNVNQMIKHLQQLVADNPKAGELPIYCPSDDEGNDYNELENKPEHCYLLKPEASFFNSYSFLTEEDLKDYEKNEYISVVML